MSSGSPIVIKLVVTSTKMASNMSYSKRCNSGTNILAVTSTHLIECKPHSVWEDIFFPVKLAKHS